MSKLSRYLPGLLMLLMLIQVSVPANGQASGRAYEFLALPATARITALGGYAVPDTGHDLGTALVFPSLLNAEVAGHLSLNFVDYFSDINYGMVGFAQTFPRFGTFSASIQYVNYGKFIEADETGQTYGSFSAGDYSLMVGWGKRLGEQLSIGSNLKMVFSSYHEYFSMGLAADVSLTYVDPQRNLAAGLLARNMGRQLLHYRRGNKESLPFDLILGVSKKLENAPFRLSLVAHNLHQYDLSYPQPLIPGQATDPETANGTRERLSDISDKLMRHLVLGLEFVPSHNFSLRMGYNYRRRQEMKVDTRLSTVGFSWGFGIRISRFHLNYGRSNYHLAGAPNHLSVSTSISELFQRPERFPEDP